MSDFGDHGFFSQTVAYYTLYGSLVQLRFCEYFFGELLSLEFAA